MADQTRAGFNDKYRTGRVIGKGTFSIVKECIDRTTGVRFAVKCINKVALKPKDFCNLMREIHILQYISHPNIIALHDVYEDDHVCYLVMEYAGGGELFDRILAKEYYTEAEAKRVVKVVAKVLRYCHAKGITHRDLKPENLLYADKIEDSVLKIADFGFAKLATDESNMFTMCGTPGYYAPEIIRKLPYDSKCDIWSLGVVAYILLCGFPPFYEENQVDEMRKILSGDFEFVAPFFDAVSPQAKELICHMLVVQPSKRYTAQQVLDHPWFNDIKEADDDVPVLLVGKTMKATRHRTARSRLRAGLGVVLAVTKTQRLVKATRALPV